MYELKNGLERNDSDKALVLLRFNTTTNRWFKEDPISHEITKTHYREHQLKEAQNSVSLSYFNDGMFF